VQKLLESSGFELKLGGFSLVKLPIDNNGSSLGLEERKR